MERFVKNLTGADKVILYGEIVRQSDAAPGTKEQPPASDPHADINGVQAARNALELLPPDEKDYAYTRVLHLSNWRTFSPPPQDRPLAVVNAQTMEDDEGVLSIAIWQNDPPPKDLANLPAIPSDGSVRLGEATVFPYRERHEWNYFSNMSRDEVLTIKLHDNGHRIWRTAHCAFLNDAEGCHVRSSIEIRSCCYFK